MSGWNLLEPRTAGASWRIHAGAPVPTDMRIVNEVLENLNSDPYYPGHPDFIKHIDWVPSGRGVLAVMKSEKESSTRFKEILTL